MASSLPLQVAETIQTVHINRDPSPSHDINPSTAASKKEPVVLDEEASATTKKEQQQHIHTGFHHHHEDKNEFDDDSIDDYSEDDNDSEKDVPFSVLRPKPRTGAHHLPPIPDLRYEQSYLHSIRNADTWWKVAWITTRDQVMMPFAQGILYNLGVCGWQSWNRNARVHGTSVGARIRRWWYGVNNWPIPPPAGTARTSQRVNSEKKFFR
ncbi:hypothetical protein B0H66DRAFT_536806 [Apodospora peruviana]|uniref:DUF1770-domain-containing protein n=1 Tax=Apodospora peruviana TaxID=516989 RepID=A0AAE0HV88_9PEZI|nr:hypothetical protein B0H66DRAFT_536806 [Apodospora peruviana]